jgi:hypothetical protein
VTEEELAEMREMNRTLQHIADDLQKLCLRFVPGYDPIRQACRGCKVAESSAEDRRRVCARCPDGVKA